MKLQTLNELRCPYCATRLEVSEAIDIKQDCINQALVRCDCSTYPLIEGILVLKNNIPDSNYLAVSCLGNRQPEQALYYLIKPKSTIDRFIQAARRRKLIFSRLANNIRIRLIRDYVHNITDKFFFADSVSSLKIGGYGDYFLHRFSSTSFLASLPLALILKDFSGPILEIGSGMGHYGFIITSLYPQKKLFCVDASFINLFLAKRFFAPQAEFICLDANDPLPFREGKFNTIFSSDALHYLPSKKLVMQEINRIAQEDAMLLFTHLHNSKAQNPVAGSPLTAEGWLRLSPFPCVRLLSEPRVFEDFLQKDACNLLEESSLSQLQQADAFILVASNNSRPFKNYSKIGERYFQLDNSIVLNPLYHLSKKGNRVILRKRWPTDFIKTENKAADKILPDTCVLDEEIINAVRDNKISQRDAPRIIQLMKRFVFVHAPKHYHSFY